MRIGCRRATVLGLIGWSALFGQGCLQAPVLDHAAVAPALPQRSGALVLAHGGDTGWNDAVLDAVSPLPFPVEVAFGMGRPDTIEEAVARLEQRGAREIVVIPLFLSAESFRERIAFLLGLRDELPPADAAPHGGHAAPHGGDHGEGHGSMTLRKIDSQASFHYVQHSLMDSPYVEEILLERARSLSRDPKGETLLLLAHGVGDEEANSRWQRRIEEVAAAIGERCGFRAAFGETLREDWPEPRRMAEARIRRRVVEGTRDGGRVLVVPFRVHGFGPYAEVLEGLDYVADGRGLLPHALIGRWIEERYEEGVRHFPSVRRRA